MIAVELLQLTYLHRTQPFVSAIEILNPLELKILKAKSPKLPKVLTVSWAVEAVARLGLGLCPGQKVTGGKVKSSQTRTVVNRAANAFRMAAFSLTHSHSALGAFYRRLRSRLGAPKAITATAHKLARLFYKVWITAGQYSDPGMD